MSATASPATRSVGSSTADSVEPAQRIGRGRTSLVFFQQNAALGLTERYLLWLMEGLDQDLYEATFLCPATPVLADLASQARRAGVSVRLYEHGRSTAALMADLRRAFLEFRPALVHFNDPCLVGILAARAARVPRRLMTHHTPELPRSYSWRGRLLERLALASVQHAVFTSEEDRDTAARREGWRPDRSSVIPYGIDLERFTPRPRTAARGSVVVGNVARLCAQKAHVELLATARIVVDRHPEVSFVIAGEGESRSEIEAEIRRLGLDEHVRLLGHREDVADVLAGCDLFALSSHFEGLCAAVIEAAAMGLPVVATAVGGLPYSVEDGVTGILVPPRDPGAMAGALLRLIEHPDEARAMGRAGSARARRLFTRQRMVAETQSLYRRLLAEA